MVKTATVSFRCDESFKAELERLTSQYDASVGECIQWCILHSFKEWLSVKKAEQKTANDTRGAFNEVCANNRTQSQTD